MTKHTPGPWQVVEGKLAKSALEVHANSRAICELWRRGHEETELANARLIAAAPEMLEALQDLVMLAEVAMREAGNYMVDDELVDARAAIARATKKEECADEDGDVMCSACNCWKATRANCS